MIAITNDLLLGIALGVMLTLLFTAVRRQTQQLMRPGCLLVYALIAVSVVVLALTGVIDVQFLRL
jgi:multisubunit Na+/H+ antiporter MnhE subunit